MFYFLKRGGPQTLRRRLVAPFVMVRLVDLAEKAPISSKTSVTIYRSKSRDIPEHLNLSKRKLYTKCEWLYRV